MAISVDITSYGSKYWYNNHNEHNNYGPASEYYDSDKEWRYYQMLHRLDGPAREFASGHKEWWIYGTEYHTYLEYLVAVELHKPNNKPNVN